MIDNFDHLVARCVAKRRRVMIRHSLFITSAILFVVVLIAGYLEMFSTHDVTVTTPKVLVVSSGKTPKAVTPPIDQHPITILPTVTLKEKDSDKNAELSPKNESKNPLYVLQLTSNKSYESVRVYLSKIPKQYQSGMGIYLVNNYYTLRYSDIYDASRIVPLINEFKELGFQSPILFKYNPERIPLTDKMAALTALTPSTPKQPSVEIPTQDNPVLVAPHNNTNSIFSVTSSPKVPSADPIGTFKQNPTYETAITIARDFYGKNNFVDAATWAKKANQINREQEEAWLLYAQSYWAQGRKKEAVGVLELYMNYKDSKAATELYRTWKSSSTN